MNYRNQKHYLEYKEYYRKKSLAQYYERRNAYLSLTQEAQKEVCLEFTRRYMKQLDEAEGE